ncbi:MAG: hypothetical protein AAF614_35405 [Chloroflexota bacterium]
MQLIKRHHNNIHRFLWVISLLIFAACAPPIVDKGHVSPDGVAVDSRFEDSFDALGRVRTLGEPITVAYSPENNGRFVQYFERVRLDSVGSEILLYPLGTWAYEGVNQTAIVEAAVPENGRSRTFENGETVYDAFLVFYEDHDGEQLLGNPISPQFQEGGIWTQYFANGRLEWHPELPVGQRVQLGLLGQAHFDDQMAADYRPTANFIPGPSAGVTNVALDVAVSSPILYSGDEQTLFVTVFSSDGSSPLVDMRLQAVVFDENGRLLDTIDLPRSNSDGRSQQQIALPNISAGQDIKVQVQALNSSGSSIGTTSLLFKTWW